MENTPGGQHFQTRGLDVKHLNLYPGSWVSLLICRRDRCPCLPLKTVEVVGAQRFWMAGPLFRSLTLGSQIWTFGPVGKGNNHTGPLEFISHHKACWLHWSNWVEMTKLSSLKALNQTETYIILPRGSVGHCFILRVTLNFRAVRELFTLALIRVPGEKKAYGISVS